MNILIIDDDPKIRKMLTDILLEDNHTVFEADGGTKGFECLRSQKIDVCFCDLWMPSIGGIDILKQIKEEFPDIEVVMISGEAKINHAVTATKIGAYDFIEKPLSVNEITDTVKRLKAKKKEHTLSKSSFEMDSMVGESAAMESVKELIENAAKSDARILITGENGTGKELVARLVQLKSSRSNKPFISVNCAAIPENLIESELFGHTKGSFTGATNDRVGKFEMADTGTLFLDEVGDMSLTTQAKVLRVLQDMKVTKIGASETTDIDVRIISATNKDLKEEIKKGNFREDLFYRLNVIPFYISPLRERKDDIPLLVKYYLKKICDQNKIPMKKVSKEAMDYMVNYSWPGNIRQLRNIIERLTIMVVEEEITLDDINKYFDEESVTSHTGIDGSKYENYKLNVARDEFEKDFIENKLVENGFNISKTAKALGLYPSNLHSKMNKLGIDLDELKKKI